MSLIFHSNFYRCINKIKSTLSATYNSVSIKRGFYLSCLDKPITDKYSTDESNNKLICASSAMQGWRDDQEDAHNCILDYDTDTSYFAVYDGHGGGEVAEYCSNYLPDFLKSLDNYTNGNIEKALEEAFLQFDATIMTNETNAILMKYRKRARKNRIQRKEDFDEECAPSDETDQQQVSDQYGVKTESKQKCESIKSDVTSSSTLVTAPVENGEVIKKECSRTILATSTTKAQTADENSMPPQINIDQEKIRTEKLDKLYNCK